MAFVKRYLNEILISLGLFLAYFATRLYNISYLPIFTDEAIYIRWSQIAKYDASWRFISLTDGKQPSFVWIDMIFMKFVNDPLLAGRLVSVASGFFALVGIYFLGREVFKNHRIGLISAVLYVIYPFSIVYDRMALYDSLVTTAAIWALYFEVLLIRLKRLDIALILGIVLGFGVLTKSSAFFYLYLLPFSLLLFDFKVKHKLCEFLKWVGLAVLSSVMALSIYSIQRLSPFFHIIEEKNSIFVYPVSEWIRHPFEFFFGNLNGLTDWFISYTTIPVFVLIVVSFLLGGTKHLREKVLLFLWFIIPFVLLALFGKVLYPRFILFMTMPLLVLSAYSLNYAMSLIKNNLLKAGVLLVVSLPMLYSNFYILTDFARAPIAKADTDQFVNAWPAGGGVKEIVSYFGEKAKSQKIYVATEGTFGSLPTYAMEIYLDENKNIQKRGIWPLQREIPKDLPERAKTMRVYLVLNTTQIPPDNWPIKLVTKYQKGIGNSYMSVYEVIPNK
ncbi:MAG: glycosyltransferase family 39 protein [bacterium]|nr:glycosyltransferase family 39 protein [bacterium]